MKKDHLRLSKTEFRALLDTGKTLQELGDMWGVSREAVRQRIRKVFPELTRKDYGIGLKVSRRLPKVLKYRRHKDDKISRRKSICFSRKAQNSKKTKWGWELKREDIIFHDTCPILGIPIDWESEIRNDNSPSFDRIDNSKGYVPGNVEIISWRANRIKNDGTEEEHYKIFMYLRNKRL